MDNYNASITPAAKPPLGVTPNFINPPSEKDIIIAYTTIFTIIATFGVAVRMYVRLFIMRKIQIEDCKLSQHNNLLADTYLRSPSPVVGELLDLCFCTFTDSNRHSSWCLTALSILKL